MERTWPPERSEARVGYVGELRTSADLKPSPNFFKKIGDLFVGARKPAPLFGPRAVLLTSDGTKLWVADPGGRCLHLFDLRRRIYRKIDQVAGLPLLSPVGICRAQSGFIYVCDSESATIYRLRDADGKSAEVLRISQGLIRPVAMDYDLETDLLYVVDAAEHNVKVLKGGGEVVRIIGKRGAAPGELNFPCDIRLAKNKLWIADTGNQRVQALSHLGEPLSSFGNAGDAPGDLALPKALALDSDNHIYVVDGRFENIQVFNESGALLLVIGEEGTGPGEFWLPGGIFVDDADRIWICDTYNRRVQVFDYLKPLSVEAAQDEIPDSKEEHATEEEGLGSRGEGQPSKDSN